MITPDDVTRILESAEDEVRSWPRGWLRREVKEAKRVMQIIDAACTEKRKTNA